VEGLRLAFAGGQKEAAMNVILEDFPDSEINRTPFFLKVEVSTLLSRTQRGMDSFQMRLSQ